MEQKFAGRTKIKKPAYRAIPRNLNDILCVKEERTVYPDNTFFYKGIKYQIRITPYRASYAKARIVGDSKNYSKKEEGSLEERLLKGDISILQKR